jgi:hypothetical protein
MTRELLVARPFAEGRLCRPFAWGLVGLLVCMGLVISGCSMLPTKNSAPSAADSGTMEDSQGGMTQAEMELAFGNLVDAIEGPPGALRTRVEGVDVFLISDPANDRMRMVVQVARADDLDARYLNVLLQANFHVTLDARYAISNGTVFATYLHPISSLTAAEIESALGQVVSLRKNFGSSFSSGVLQFGTPE